MRHGELLHDWNIHLPPSSQISNASLGTWNNYGGNHFGTTLGSGGLPLLGGWSEERRPPQKLQYSNCLPLPVYICRVNFIWPSASDFSRYRRLLCEHVLGYNI